MSRRVNVTAWIESKGRASLETAFRLLGVKYNRAGDAEVAGHLAFLAACEGIKGEVTAATVGKARSRLGLVAYRSRRAPAAAGDRPEIATPARIDSPRLLLFEEGSRLPPITESEPTLGAESIAAEFSRINRESVARDERIAVALEKIANHLGQIEAAAWAREKRERGTSAPSLVAAGGGA